MNAIHSIELRFVIITILFPKLIPIITTYGSYRLECSIRGATLLGIFGVGFTSIMVIYLMKDVSEAEMAGYNSFLGQLFYNLVLASSNNLDFLKNIYLT